MYKLDVVGKALNFWVATKIILVMQAYRVRKWQILTTDDLTRAIYLFSVEQLIHYN